jgi:kinesin family member 11
VQSSSASNGTNNLASEITMSDLAPSNVASKASSFGNANSAGTNVQVAVRCRPSNAEEKKTNQPTVITCDSENKSLKVSFGPAGKKISKAYTFDKVFGMYSTQEEVFESIVRPIVDEALAGFNCTIFAYGQTGALRGMPVDVIVM